MMSYPLLFVASLNTNVLIIGGDMNAQIGKKTETTNSAYTTRQTEMDNRFHNRK